MTRKLLATSLAAALLAGAPAPGLAVVIASGDGTGNTRSPMRSLPWHHVGRQGSYSAVYLGNRWVLTAAHVGAREVSFAGVRYEPIPASVTAILNPDGSASDLLAYRVEWAGEPGRAAPPLSLLPLAAERPTAGTLLLLAGNGHDRGEALAWGPTGAAPRHGWARGAGRSLRWGTNRLDLDPGSLTFRGVTTRVLAMTFTQPGRPGATRHEAQAVLGDSGGAVFARQHGRFVLSGILIVRSEGRGQPRGAALFGDRSFAADVSAYRDQLLALTRPDCADGWDNDDDGRLDFPADPQCRHPADDSEAGR